MKRDAPQHQTAARTTTTATITTTTATTCPTTMMTTTTSAASISDPTPMQCSGASRAYAQKVYSIHLRYAWSQNKEKYVTLPIYLKLSTIYNRGSHWDEKWNFGQFYFSAEQRKKEKRKKKIKKNEKIEPKLIDAARGGRGLALAIVSKVVFKGLKRERRSEFKIKFCYVINEWPLRENILWR